MANLTCEFQLGDEIIERIGVGECSPNHRSKLIAARRHGRRNLVMAERSRAWYDALTGGLVTWPDDSQRPEYAGIHSVRYQKAHP
jgi:hypothetical protein